jgi:hypothetical protein
VRTRGNGARRRAEDKRPGCGAKMECYSTLASVRKSMPASVSGFVVIAAHRRLTFDNISILFEV